MEIDVKVDTREFERTLNDLQRNQFPFALSVALNRTAEDTNAELRRVLPKRFIIREPKVVSYIAPTQLPRDQRATKRNLESFVTGKGYGRIFDPFETGRRKTAQRTDEPVAIPTEQLRPNRRTVVPKYWYPRNLGLFLYRDPKGTSFYALGKGSKTKGLTPFSKTKRGVTQIKGKRGTFILDPAIHRGVSAKGYGVYVRIGKGREDVRMIWAFRQSVPRPPILELFKTARATASRRWQANLEGALAHAIKTAK